MSGASGILKLKDSLTGSRAATHTPQKENGQSDAFKNSFSYENELFSCFYTRKLVKSLDCNASFRSFVGIRDCTEIIEILNECFNINRSVFDNSFTVFKYRISVSAVKEDVG